MRVSLDDVRFSFRRIHAPRNHKYQETISRLLSEDEKRVLTVCRRRWGSAYSSAVDVPDGATQVFDAVIDFNVHLLTIHSLVNPHDFNNLATRTQLSDVASIFAKCAGLPLTPLHTNGFRR